MINIEGKLIEMETKRNMVIDYLEAYRRYNKENNTDIMDEYIERCEELLAKYDLIIEELQSYKGVNSLY